MLVLADEPTGDLDRKSADDVLALLRLLNEKYGKTILDRALTGASTLDEAAKLSLLSFDATLRSNLSVDAPIDLLRYTTDSLSAHNFVTFEKDNPYWVELRRRYAEGLSALVADLPPPPATGRGAVIAPGA